MKLRVALLCRIRAWGAVRFFLEPDNYVTGQVLTVDGGLTL